MHGPGPRRSSVWTFTAVSQSLPASMRQKVNFARASNPITHVQIRREKYCDFYFSEIMIWLVNPASMKRDVRVVTLRGGGGGGRESVRRCLRKTTDAVADGQAAWS